MPILHSISSGCHVRPRPRCPAPVRCMATRARLTATGWHTDRSIRLTGGLSEHPARPSGRTVESNFPGFRLSWLWEPPQPWSLKCSTW
ncbi:MAG: hypothetical protein K0R13_3333 [Propionibacteriaceae bacterium]|nr:hypothetical protein [Propionibacteriaceae bacterium]